MEHHRLRPPRWLAPQLQAIGVTLGMLGAALLGSLCQVVAVLAGAAGLVAGLVGFDLPTLRWATWLLGLEVVAALHWHVHM